MHVQIETILLFKLQFFIFAATSCDFFAALKTLYSLLLNISRKMQRWNFNFIFVIICI